MMNKPPDTIVCVECGGTARLSTFLPTDELLEDGFPLSYVCPDCFHRHDLVWTNEPEDD
jgi:hypothetical protein